MSLIWQALRAAVLKPTTCSCWSNICYNISNYSVSQKKIPHRAFVAFFPKRLGIFRQNFTCVLHIPIYARLQIFIQLSATLTKLCHIKCDHPACVLADGGHFWAQIETRNRHVKFRRKIPNRLGKMSENLRGGDCLLALYIYQFTMTMDLNSMCDMYMPYILPVLCFTDWQKPRKNHLSQVHNSLTAFSCSKAFTHMLAWMRPTTLPQCRHN